MGRMLKIGTGAVILCFILLFNSYKAIAGGNNITIPAGLSQSEFRDLTEQVGLAISYMPLAPAEPLGLLGFDAGIEITAVNISQSLPVWSKVISDGKIMDYIYLPKLHVQKGLPLGLDVGVVYTKMPNSNLSMIGGELKWAFLQGGIVMPAVALRASYTKLLGVSDVDLNTYGLDLSASKGIAFLTPYAGIGMVWITSRAHANGVTLKAEQVNRVKGFAGLRISILHFISLVAEADFSKIQAYSLRANISF
jgi:Family of unknown function (DUF6588)